MGQRRVIGPVGLSFLGSRARKVGTVRFLGVGDWGGGSSFFPVEQPIGDGRARACPPREAGCWSSRAPPPIPGLNFL